MNHLSAVRLFSSVLDVKQKGTPNGDPKETDRVPLWNGQCAKLHTYTENNGSSTRHTNKAESPLMHVRRFQNMKSSNCYVYMFIVMLYWHAMLEFYA